MSRRREMTDKHLLEETILNKSEEVQNILREVATKMENHEHRLHPKTVERLDTMYAAAVNLVNAATNLFHDPEKETSDDRIKQAKEGNKYGYKGTF